VIRYALPYQPMSSREWKSSVILGMALTILVDPNTVSVYHGKSRARGECMCGICTRATRNMAM
jgi:hypothetical protein